MRSRWPMAEDGPGPEREHGRHPAPLRREQPMTDGVDPAVDAVQASAGHAVAHAAAAEAEVSELSDRHDPVLLCRHPRDPGIEGTKSRFRSKCARFLDP